MSNFYITGDTHGCFDRIIEFAFRMGTTKEDVLIILGDAGVNFYLNQRDIDNKILLSKLDLTILCIKGNHEKYPENLPNYKLKKWYDGEVFYEEEYPNLLFAKDGSIYNFNGMKTLVIGGAYSVDKYYRLARGWTWFDDEQPSEELKAQINKMIETNNTFDYVLTHTCPYSVRPTHLFLAEVDQSTVDSSTELWLEEVKNKISFKKWYFGHYHDDWRKDNFQMLFNSFDELRKE